jgi:uncharacterized protein YndB with AHSA1/START domain
MVCPRQPDKIPDNLPQEVTKYMARILDVQPLSNRELVLARLIAAPRTIVWRCWTESDLLKKWFAPKPFTTPIAALDVRPGGSSNIVMRGPDGQDVPNPGVYLEVVPQKKLVFTNAYSSAWEPTERPFITVVLTFEDEGKDTRYIARVKHWTQADKKAHEEMGFSVGWGICADQLEAIASNL